MFSLFRTKDVTSTHATTFENHCFRAICWTGI